MGTIKTYKASSEISITIRLPKKANKHIRFDVLSNGSSVFSTGDKDIQSAIEKHSRFGELFTLVDTQETKEEREKETVIVPKLKEVSVGSIAEAKDYLAETFEVERTKLADKDSIVRAAAEHGIEFVGI